MSNPPKLDDALKILHSLKQVNHPSAWVISYLTGFAYFRKEEYNSAVKNLELAVKKGGSSFEIFQLLMEACMKTNRLARAKELISHVLKMKEDDVAAWRNLAIIYSNELKYEDALIAIGKANSFARSDLSLATFAGKIYGNHGKYAEALNTFETIIKVKPDYLDAHLGKAWVFNKTGKLSEAKLLLTNLLNQIPDNKEARALLADCLSDMDDTVNAIPIYEKLVSEFPDDIDLVKSYASCLSKAGLVDEAKNQIVKLLDKETITREILHFYATVLMKDSVSNSDFIHSELIKLEKRLPRASVFNNNKPSKLENNRKLKVGIISDALWDNPVGRKWESILEKLPKEFIKVVAFSTIEKDDAVSARIVPHCSVYQRSHQISPVALAENIHNQELDILIDASSEFSTIIDFVLQQKPCAISISSNDRVLQAFEFNQYDFRFYNGIEEQEINQDNAPTFIEVNEEDGLSLASALMAAHHQASTCSDKQWNRGDWQQRIDSGIVAHHKKEIEQKISSQVEENINQKAESEKIFTTIFWKGFTDNRKAKKIVELSQKFSAINQTDVYLQKIIDETAERLKLEPTDNVAFYIQTMALLSRKPERITQANPQLIEALQLKNWTNKLPLFSYWFEKVEKLHESAGTKVSAVIISNKFKEKSVENLKQLSKQLKGIGEIIFVNNGIEDDAFSALFPYVNTYVKANGNSGAYLARNLGAVFAKGDFLLFVDDDGIPQPNFVQAHLKEHKEREIVASRGMYYSSNVINDPWHYNIGNEVIPAFTILEGNAMYKSEAFYKAGGWGDYILFGHGGKDLSYRLLEHYPDKEQQIYVPQSRLHHEYLRGSAHQKEKKMKQEVSLRLLEAMHPAMKQTIESWPVSFRVKTESLVPKKSVLPIGEGKKTKFFHFCRNHVYAQALSDMIEVLNANSDQQHWLLVEKTHWNVAGGYTIEEGKNPSTLFFDCNSNSDMNGIISELLLPEVTAVFMHGIFRRWEYNLVDQIGDKLHLGWMIWGGDLYKPIMNNQKMIIQHRKFSSILTPVDGDAELFYTHFGEKPRYDFAYPYPGLYGNLGSPKYNQTKKILVGNSGDPSNNHIQTLQLLSQKKDIQEYQIIMPLAYNFKAAYKQEVLTTIDELGLSDQVVFHEQFILPDEYLKLINEVDMLVMAHDRQQAIGNTLMGLFLGKQIFIKDKISMNDSLVDNPSWDFLHDNGFSLKSIDQFAELENLGDLPPINEQLRSTHQEIIKTKFGLAARAEILKNSCDLIAENVISDVEDRELQPA